MANSPQSQKRAAKRNAIGNATAGQKSKARTYIKKVQAAIANGDAEPSRRRVGGGHTIIDRTAAKGIMHKNKAARHKSRLSAGIKALPAKGP